MPTGVGRASVMALHGHVWQRDPYLAEHTRPLGKFGGLHLPAGKPVQHGIASRCLGQNALGMSIGAQDSITPMAHFDWLFASAGGGDGVLGDYLMRDIGGFGITSGQWGLLRVKGKAVPKSLQKGLRVSCQ